MPPPWPLSRAAPRPLPPRLTHSLPASVVLQAKESPPGAAPVRSTPVHRVAFSPDGGSVAACGTAGGARAQRFPPSRFGDEGASLWAGHSASVASLCWSACSSRVLTASADGTARLFAAGRADPLLVFSHLRRPPAPGDPPLPPSGGAASASAARANAPLGASVQAARFLAGDKAVVLAAGGRVLFYGYDLASLGSQADLRRARVRRHLPAAARTATPPRLTLRAEERAPGGCFDHRRTSRRTSCSCRAPRRRSRRVLGRPAAACSRASERAGCDLAPPPCR